MLDDFYYFPRSGVEVSTDTEEEGGSLVQFVWDKVTGLLSSSSNRRHLPSDILADILSRLSAEFVHHCEYSCKPLRALTSAPFFRQLHYSKASPVIAFYYCRKEDDRLTDTSGKVYVNFTDETGNFVTTKSMPIQGFRRHHTFYGSNLGRMYSFYGSLNGFLIFQRTSMHLDIWNPITNQKIEVKNNNHQLCFGFYLHPVDMEYRVLFGFGCLLSYFEYYIYSFSSTFSKGGKFHHPPRMEKAPITLNGALHWMVCDAIYSKIHNASISDCLNSVISFDMKSEMFRSIPHPGHRCGLTRRHQQMELMVFEGHLCLCNASKVQNLTLWILEDYENKAWEKRFVMDMQPLESFCGIHCDISNAKRGHFQIFNKELLMTVSNTTILLYHLELGTIRRVGKALKKKNKENNRCRSNCSHKHPPISSCCSFCTTRGVLVE